MIYLSPMKQKNILILTQPVSHVRLGGIARFAKTHGWHLVIADRLARLPVGWTGDGALVSARGDKAALTFIRGLVRKGIPVVDLTIDHPEIRVPRASGDHEACGRLDRLFAETLHSSVQKESMRLRLDEVSFRLEHTDHPIKKIAADMGFSSAAHLTSAFRHATGSPPSAWRQKNARTIERPS